MKVAILAGGKGTRLSELTKNIPKPMVKIGSKPILVHIIEHYFKYGHRDFYILAGYKKKVIMKYFKNFIKINKPFKFTINKINCNVTILDSGTDTMTGGRLKVFQSYLKDEEEFLFTYGDGISKVDLKKLVNFHRKHNKIITVTSVRPPARFGEIVIKNNLVISFKEKPQVTQGWINGGFFVAKKNFLNFIKNKNSILEKEPLELAAKKKQLTAYKHYGFWKCMDTLRDREVLQQLHKKKLI